MLKKIKKIEILPHKTYFNYRLKQVNFHGMTTFPLYVQVTFARKTHFFKSYYFELFTKERYSLKIPGTCIAEGSRHSPSDYSWKQKLSTFITEKHPDDFSLELFKKEAMTII